MGLARVDFVNGFTPKVRRVLAHPDERTPAQKARAKRRTEYRAKLRAKYAKRHAATQPAVAHASVAKLLGNHKAPDSAALMKVIVKAGTFGLIVTAPPKRATPPTASTTPATRSTSASRRTSPAPSSTAAA